MGDGFYSVYSLPFYFMLAFDGWVIQNIVHRAIVLNVQAGALVVSKTKCTWKCFSLLNCVTN